ncbi:MAG: UDP-N-acetylmuramoyl-L-alanine--D-glutamate ligase, partial [Planctomycetota bacterium]|nr:UDP-N-acetylmuramoyl-L-alanine--D-glutamate ligase [Planctomycetota bacterium]
MTSPPRDLSSKRVVVMGLGRFGGGLGVTQWLASQNADILLTDLANESELAEPLAALTPLIANAAITLRLGEHNVSDFTTADLIIANPAVPKPWNNRFLRAAQAAAVPITTEVRLLIERLPNPARLIAVTGSVGKSTTAAMTAHALRAIAPHHQTHLGGNIGGTLLNHLPSISPEDFIVLELSSAMLHWLTAGA